MLGRDFLNRGRSGHRTFGFFTTAQRHKDRLRAAIAEHHDAYNRADVRVADHRHQTARVLDGLTFVGQDHITRLQACLKGGTGGHIGDQRTLDGVQFKRFGQFRIHVLDADTQPAATGFAKFLQLIHDAGHNGCRHRKADPDGAAVGRQDRRIHADHFAIHVEQRPTRVAPVNRGVGLDVVVIGARQRAFSRRNDARADREPLAQRIAHRHHPIAHAHRVAIPKGHKRQGDIALHLKYRDVGVGVGPDHFGGQFRPGKELDQDLIRALNDVVVRHDITIL